jgi:type IV pilus assembly protein PilM
MLEFLNLKPEAFGLDISDSSLKIAKLKEKKKSLVLSSFGEAKIEPGIVEKGELKDVNALSSIITETISKAEGEKIKTKYVIASLPEEKAFLQVIQMPLMNEEELGKAILFEAENYIPLPIEDAYLDFQIIRPVVDHLDHFDILLAALPREIIDSYIDCFKKAGLIPKALEIESQAVARALIKNETIPSPYLLIDLGETKTNFIIFSGFSLRFTSSIPLFSRKLTESIADRLKIDLKKAEKIKLKYGIGGTQFKDKDKEEAVKVSEIITPFLEKLIEQIKDYLTYYHTHVHHEHLPLDGKEVEKILLCGGSANLKGLTDFLSLRLKIPVELGNPWINILPEPLKEVPDLNYEKSLSYTTALGLALRDIRQ